MRSFKCILCVLECSLLSLTSDSPLYVSIILQNKGYITYMNFPLNTRLSSNKMGLYLSSNISSIWCARSCDLVMMYYISQFFGSFRVGNILGSRVIPRLKFWIGSKLHLLFSVMALSGVLRCTNSYSAGENETRKPSNTSWLILSHCSFEGGAPYLFILVL